MITKDILRERCGGGNFFLTKKKLCMFFGFYIKARSWNVLVEKISAMDVLLNSYKEDILCLCLNKCDFDEKIRCALKLPNDKDIKYYNIARFFIKDIEVYDVYMKTKHKNFKASSALEGIFYE